jgi:hypothetical protein
VTCANDTRWNRNRLHERWLSHLYQLGIISSFGIHGGGGGQWHLCSKPHWFGRPVYILYWPREKWECLVMRRHWPYWPDGNPIAFGLCGRCAPWPCCKSIEHEHAPECEEANL